MMHFRAAVLCLLSLAPAAYALSPEVAERVQRAVAWASIGSPALSETPGVTTPKDEFAVRNALAARSAIHAAIELTGVCRNQQFRTPGWCPKADQAVIAPDGGLTVSAGDDVDLELTVPLLWAVGRHAFMIVSAEALERPNVRPAFGTVVDFGVPGVQQLKFRADRPGDYVFFEPYGRSVTGRFSVRP